MKRDRNVQYTIRDVSPALDSALRERARAENKSLNAVALESLSVGLRLSGAAVRYHDLDFAIGTWVEDPEFDAAIKAQDKIDPALWR